MATVSKWTPFGVALDITATGGTVTRTSATQFTVVINASWETYYEGAQTNYGMSATSGGVTKTISSFGTKRSSGSTSFTGTYSISGNGSATKTITVTFKNYEENWEGNVTESASKNVTFNVTVPAWTSYKITYNANGGSGAPGAQTKWKDQTLTLSSTKPTRTGYSFLGWSTSSSATTATYSAGGSYTANSAATLYAVWKANTYKVTYNANGGSGAPANQTKTYGVTLKLSSTVPTRTNYTFKGWATSSSATTATYAAGANYTANAAVTLYAVWELAYVKPRIEWFDVLRVNPASETDWEDCVESDEGEYLNIRFRYSTDRRPVTISIEMNDESLLQKSINNQVYTYDSWESGDFPFQIECSLEQSHTVKITVSDSGGSTSKTVIIPSAMFTIDYKHGGKGVGIGKTAEEDDLLDIGFRTRFFGGILQPVLEPDTDLNDVKTPNTYTGENVSTYNYGNCPITSGTFTLEVKAAGPSGQIYQKLIVCDKKAQLVYERYFYTNAWGDWFGGWIYPTLGSEFTMYGTSEADNKTKYRKDGRLVELRGIVKPVADIAGGTANHTICTLQDGYRPSSPIYLLCQGSSNCSWLLKIGTDGDVGFSRYRNGDTTATAAAGTWLPFQATFFIK